MHLQCGAISSAAHSPSRPCLSQVARFGADLDGRHTLADLPAVLPWADIILLAASHTADSHHMANAAFFEHCRYAA